MRTYLQRCDALGMRMSEQIGSGRIRASQIEPGQLSPGEFSHRVRRDVDEFGARMVLIDSINGYLHAIPQSDAPLARMHELLSFLNERGVATILVLAQHGIVGTMMTHAARRQLPGGHGDDAALLRGAGPRPPGHLGRQDADAASTKRRSAS